MTQNQQALLTINGAIQSLPPAELDICIDLCEHITASVNNAGDAGRLALAKVAFETAMHFEAEQDFTHTQDGSEKHPNFSDKPVDTSSAKA